MKKNLKFMKYATLCVISIFMTSLAFTGCKNYDGDIDRIDSDIAALKSQLSTFSNDLNAAKTDLSTLKTSVAGFISKTDAEAAIKKAKEEAIAASEALIEELEGKITDLKADLDEALETIGEGGISEEMQKEFDALKKEVEDALAQVVNLKDISEMVTVVSGFPHHTMLNSIIGFNTTKAVVDYTFGKGLVGETVFKLDELVGGEGAAIYVQINPANAIISADQVFFMNSENDKKINEFITIEVERYEGLLTRTLENGIWRVNVSLVEGFTKEDIEEYVYDENENEILFSFVVENLLVDDVDRFVSSSFSYTFDPKDPKPAFNPNKAPTADGTNLAFEANGKSHKEIRNRYTASENGTATKYVEQRWASGKDQTGKYQVDKDGKYVTEKDVADNRQAKQPLIIENGVVKVEIKNDNIYKYYVALDVDNAVESAPSELVAWQSYDVKGLNEVKLASEAIELQIPSKAKGDFIGFRVYAVNYNGTLVDPDGKAFYVYVGSALPEEEVEMEFALNYEIYTANTGNTKVMTAPVAIEIPAGLKQTDISGYLFSMELENNVTLTAANILFLDAKGASTTIDKAVSAILVNVDPKDLGDNATTNAAHTYEGTLTYTNKVGTSTHIELGFATVYLYKSMAVSDPGVSYKTNFPAADGITYLYPEFDGVDAAIINLTSVFNGLAADMSFTNSVPTTGTAGTHYPNVADWPAIEDGAAVVPFDLTIPATRVGLTYIDPATGKPAEEVVVPPATKYAWYNRNYPYPAKLNVELKGWGYDAAAAVDIPTVWSVSPAINFSFRSHVQDFELNYLLDNVTDAKNPKTVLPELVYAQAGQEFALENIVLKSPIASLPKATDHSKLGTAKAAAPRLPLYSSLLPTDAYGNSREYTIVGVDLLTGAKFDRVNEFFTATLGLDALTGLLDVVQFNVESDAVQLSAPVATKLRFLIEDEFGHAYYITVAESFLMTLP